MQRQKLCICVDNIFRSVIVPYKFYVQDMAIFNIKLLEYFRATFSLLGVIKDLKQQYT